jgi:hypothetical protein
VEADVERSSTGRGDCRHATTKANRATARARVVIRRP